VREALRDARSLVQDARRSSDDLLLGRALTLLGVICKEVGHLRSSESCYRRALPLFERMLGPSHASVATLYHNLGGILYARGHWGRAEHWTRRAVILRTALLGRNHCDVVADQACLAPILAARGKHAEAEALYRRAIRFFSTRQRNAYEVAINSSNLGVLLDSMGRYRAAEAAYRRALGSYRAMRHAPRHDVALALYNLGVLEARHGKPEAAIRLAEAHRIFLRELGPRHSLTRESRRHLAAVRRSAVRDRPSKARSGSAPRREGGRRQGNARRQ
jgi:tetratricopeptide (TPR) repeat protein